MKGIITLLLLTQLVELRGFNLSSKIRPFRPREFHLSSSSSDNVDRMALGQGSFVAIVTPMTESGAVDIPSLRLLIKFHIENKSDGICILGTTGEATTLTMAEREEVLKVAVEEAKGIIPLLVGTGTVNPLAVKEQTLQARDLGCDAVLVVTPYYVKPPQRGLIKHYLDVADLGMPTVLYNVPGRTAVDFGFDGIAQCAQHENIVGIKDASGDVSRVAKLREALNGKEFLMYSGDDMTAADFVLAGGDGCISVTANVDPKGMHDMMMAGLGGKEVDLRNIDKRLQGLHDKLFIESNPIPAKWALNRMSKIRSAFCRPPLDALDSNLHDEVESAMKDAEIQLLNNQVELMK